MLARYDSPVVADTPGIMKKYFQGLVLGAALMYWYLYDNAAWLVTLQKWFNLYGR